MAKIECSAICAVYRLDITRCHFFYSLIYGANFYISMAYSSKVVIFIMHNFKVRSLRCHSEQIGFCLVICMSLRSSFNCLGILFTSSPMSALLTPLTSLFHFKSAIFTSTDIRTKIIRPYLYCRAYILYLHNLSNINRCQPL